MTGAATTRFWVNTPAAATGAPSAVATRARSASPDALMPQATPPATNPCGGDDAHGHMPTTARPAASGRPSMRLAHWMAWPDAPLTRLSRAARATTQPGALVGHGRDVHGVRPGRRLGRRRALGHDDERLVRPGGAEEWRAGRRWMVRPPVGRAGVAGGEDAPVHRREVRREQHLDVGAGDVGQALLDLGGVPVVEQAVGREVLVDRAERGGGLGRPAGARHPAGGVDDDARRLDQPGPQQRGERQDGGGDVAARGRHVRWPRRCGRGTARAARRRSRRAARDAACSSPYHRRVQAGVAQPEVGGQVDDAAHPAGELGHDVLRGTVGQAEEHEVEAVAGVGVVLLEGQVGIAARQARDRGRRRGVPAWVSPVATRTSRCGVLGAEAQQLSPGVPRGADDADRCHRARIRTRA